jgi:hypothetical protein
MALLIAMVAFGAIIGALYFFIQRWRVKEIARRKRRAILAASGRDSEQTEGNQAPTAENGITSDTKETTEADRKKLPQQEDPAELSVSEADAEVLSLKIRALMQDIVDKDAAYTSSRRLLREAIDKWESSTSRLQQLQNDEDFDKPCSGSYLSNALKTFASSELEIIDSERAVVNSLKGLVSIKTIGNAVTALNRELKRIASYKDHQLPSHLAALRLVAQGVVQMTTTVIKEHSDEEVSLRRRSKAVRIGGYKRSELPDTEANKELIGLLLAALDERHAANEALSDAASKARRSDSAYNEADRVADVVYHPPATATADALQRCFAATEKTQLAKLEAQQARDAAIKPLAALFATLKEKTQNVMTLLGRLYKVEEASQEIAAARALLKTWEGKAKKGLHSTQDYPTLQPSVAQTENPSANAAVYAQVEEWKEAVELSLVAIFGVPLDSVLTKANQCQRILTQRTGFPSPEKPNDTEVAKLLAHLDDWSRLALAAQRAWLEECVQVATLIEQAESAVSKCRVMVAQLKLIEGPLDAKGGAKITTVQMVQDWLEKRLSSTRTEVAKAQRANPPVAGQMAKAPEATRVLVDELRAGMRSFGFAIAQTDVAQLKLRAAQDVRLPDALLARPQQVGVDRVEINVGALVSEMEKFLASEDDDKQKKSEVSAAIDAARGSLTTRLSKKTERRTALNNLITRADGVLAADPSEELHLIVTAARKFAAMFD